MATDIVVRLRGLAQHLCKQSLHETVKLYNDAADEIERLRHQLAVAQAQTTRTAKFVHVKYPPPQLLLSGKLDDRVSESIRQSPDKVGPND